MIWRSDLWWEGTTDGGRAPRVRAAPFTCLILLPVLANSASGSTGATCGRPGPARQQAPGETPTQSPDLRVAARACGSSNRQGPAEPPRDGANHWPVALRALRDRGRPHTHNTIAQCASSLSGRPGAAASVLHLRPPAGVVGRSPVRWRPHYGPWGPRLG